jgi:hypothetical protein
MRVLTVLSVLRDCAEREEYSANPEARTMKNDLYTAQSEAFLEAACW